MHANSQVALCSTPMGGIPRAISLTKRFYSCSMHVHSRTWQGKKHALRIGAVSTHSRKGSVIFFGASLFFCDSDYTLATMLKHCFVSQNECAAKPLKFFLQKHFSSATLNTEENIHLNWFFQCKRLQHAVIGMC